MLVGAVMGEIEHRYESSNRDLDNKSLSRIAHFRTPVRAGDEQLLHAQH